MNKRLGSTVSGICLSAPYRGTKKRRAVFCIFFLREVARVREPTEQRLAHERLHDVRRLSTRQRAGARGAVVPRGRGGGAANATRAVGFVLVFALRRRLLLFRTAAPFAAFRAAFRAAVSAGSADSASASPFGSRDESLLRDALADFVVQSFASSKQSEISANLTEQNENPSDPSDDWLGNDLAAKLAAAARRASGDSRKSPEMFADSRASPRSLLGETRDGVERFLRRCGDVARARRRYASCGGLVDFAEAVTANDAIENRRLDAHRSLAKELAERVSVGADGGRRTAAETNLDCSRDSYDACDDVTHVASSLGGFLKHGVENVLGSFGLRGPTLVSKPKPSDSPTVLIFFLGGITAREIRDVRAAAANLAVGVFAENAENGAQVEDILVGSTGLLRAEGEDLVGMVA